MSITSVLTSPIVRLFAAIVETYNKWFGWHIDPEMVKARQEKMNQQQIDEFNQLLAKAKNGDKNAQQRVREILSAPF